MTREYSHCPGPWRSREAPAAAFAHAAAMVYPKTARFSLPSPLCLVAPLISDEIPSEDPAWKFCSRSTDLGRSGELPEGRLRQTLGAQLRWDGPAVISPLLVSGTSATCSLDTGSQREASRDSGLKQRKNLKGWGQEGAWGSRVQLRWASKGWPLLFRYV